MTASQILPTGTEVCSEQEGGHNPPLSVWDPAELPPPLPSTAPPPQPARVRHTCPLVPGAGAGFHMAS